MAVEPLWRRNINGRQVVGLAELDFEALQETVEALQGLASRLWSGDRPDPSSAVNAWVADLPVEEAAALNGILGQNYGYGPSWESDHPISVVLREE